MKRLSVVVAGIVLSTLLSQYVRAEGRDPAITEESKEYLDRIRPNGFDDKSSHPERPPDQPRGAQPSQDGGGMSVGEMRKQDNEVIEEGEREAKWDAMTDILSDSFKDVMEAYERDPHEEEGLTEKMIKVVTAPYAEQKRREEESKAISEAIKKAEEKHSKGEQLIINPTDATPLQKAALMTAMQCRENLSPDIEVQGPEAILNAVNACFDRVTYENRCKATTQVLRVLGHRGPQRCD